MKHLDVHSKTSLKDAHLHTCTQAQTQTSTRTHIRRTPAESVVGCTPGHRRKHAKTHNQTSTASSISEQNAILWKPKRGKEGSKKASTIPNLKTNSVRKKKKNTAMPQSAIL